MKENLANLKEEILRKIDVPSCVSGLCTIKYNDELYSLYKGPSILKMIKIATLDVSGSFSAHHQEFSSVHSALARVIQV